MKTDRLLLYPQDAPRKIIIFDTESSGLLTPSLGNSPASVSKSGDEVCQIGGIVCDSKGNVENCFCLYCDILAANNTPSAKAVNEIDMQEVRKSVPNQFLSEVLLTYLPIFFSPNNLFVGFNAKFDVKIMANTLRDLIIFEPKCALGPKVPERGSWFVDVGPFVFPTGRWRKLSSFTAELAEKTEDFKRMHLSKGVITNDPVSFTRDWEKNHNSLFDSMLTYLLWKENVWCKRIF